MTEPNHTDILARTIWGEARGTGVVGMRHVASVVLNRVAHPRWWGHDVASVCQAPWQFSCWNANDPNLPKMLAVTPTNDAWFSIAISIAERAVAGTIEDETGGADSYYAIAMRQPPPWTARAEHTFSDAWHSFWRVREADKQPDVPTLSVRAVPRQEVAADDLNARSLAGGTSPVKDGESS